jgi:hypothetical protein
MLKKILRKLWSPIYSVNIVQIEDKYAIRYRYFMIFKSYQDLTGHYTWSRDSKYFRDCLTTDLERLKTRLNYIFIDEKVVL